MCGRVRWYALVLAAALGVLATVPASAANWLELNFYLSGPRYDRELPQCNASTALSAVAVNFAQKEGRFWNSALRIVGFEDIRETAYRPWAPNTIPRRFCSARRAGDGRAEASDPLFDRRVRPA